MARQIRTGTYCLKVFVLTSMPGLFLKKKTWQNTLKKKEKPYYWMNNLPYIVNNVAKNKYELVWDIRHILAISALSILIIFKNRHQKDTLVKRLTRRPASIGIFFGQLQIIWLLTVKNETSFEFSFQRFFTNINSTTDSWTLFRRVSRFSVEFFFVSQCRKIS